MTLPWGEFYTGPMPPAVLDRAVPRVTWGRALRDWSSLRRDPLGTLAAWRRERGPVYRLPGRRPVLALSDPRDIQHVLATRQPNYHKGGNFELTRDTLGQGLVTSNGAHHDQQRRRLGSLFQRSKWPDLPGLVRVEAERVTRDAPARGPVDVSRETARIAIGVVGRALFGMDLFDRASSIADAYLEGQRYLAGGAFSFWPGWNRWIRRSAFRRATVRIVAEGEHILTRAERGGARSDFLEALLTARDDAGRPLDRKLLRDEIITFLGAGHETTGGAMGWTFDWLFRNPAAWRRLVDESRASETPPLFAEACLLESMRLRPPVWCLGRRAQETDRLPSGAVVPAGAHVVVFPHVLNWDAAHFRDPMEFRPERFLPGASEGPAPYAFLPFGAGPRSCLGEGFAMIEMTNLLHHYVRRFDWEPVGTGTARPEALVSLRPRDGVWARVRERTISA